MKTLDQIMIEHESDKASVFTRTWAKPHNYCVHLERFFEPLRDKPIKLVEIGVGGGESIRAWLEYFSQAQVFGVDLVARTNEWNDPDAKPDPRYTFVNGDQSNAVFWASFIKVRGGDWDVVIDDGSHKSSDIVTTHKCLWGHVKSGGFYEVEDLGAAVEAGDGFQKLVKSIFKGDSECDFIYFARELAILRKK